MRSVPNGGSLRAVRPLALALALALGAAVGGSLRAQGFTWRGAALHAAIDAAEWTAGPFRIAPSLVLGSAGFDSNLYYGSAGPTVGDYTFSVSLPVRVWLPLGRSLVLEVDEAPRYAHYLRTERERAWNHALVGRAHLVMKRLYVAAGGTASDVRQRLNSEIEANVRRRTSEANGVLLWQMAKSLSIEGRARSARLDHENLVSGFEDIRGRLNRDERSAGASLYLQRSPAARFSLDADAAAFTFTGDRAFKSSRSVGASAGVELLQLERLRGSLRLGWKRFDVLGTPGRDYEGLVGAVTAALRTLRRIELRGAFHRDVQFSVWSDYGFYVQTLAGGGLTRFLSRRARLDYDVTWGWNRYPPQPGGGPGAARRLDRYAVHAFALRLVLDRDLRLELGASLARRVSSSRPGPESRNFIGGTLVYGR